MSFEKCKRALRAAVRGITPTRQSRDGFTTILTTDGGHTQRLEELKSGFRYFEVVSAGTPRGASSALRTCRWVHEVLIRVRYEYTRDVDRLETLINDDVISIIKALRSPSNWDQANSGMTALQVGEEIEPERIGDDELRPDAVIIPIPVTITYKDC